MKSVRSFASATFVVFLVSILSAGAVAGWGPSWVGGGPPGGYSRPAKFDSPETRVGVFDDQSRIGVGLRFWCDAEVVKDHQYQLLCQVRVHTKKGDEGLLLGSAEQPGGTTMLVASGTADDKWNGLEGVLDITRKELSGMTNLPKGKVTALRVEPQLLDQTTNKYVTAAKTNAIILLAEVGERGRVNSVLSLANWIAQNGQYSSEKVVEMLGDLDSYDAEGNGVAEAIGGVLGLKELTPAIQLRYLGVISKDWVYLKHPVLWEAVKKLAMSDAAEVSAAAKSLLK
jgi:hypothetical protein